MMEKINSTTQHMLGLTKNEGTLLKWVDSVPRSLVEIEKRTKLPHSSLIGSLSRLVGRGLIIIVRSTNSKKRYIKNETMQVFKGRADLKGHPSHDVTIIEGKENLLTLISSVLLKNKKRRLFSFHGAQVVDGWLSILGMEEVKKRNDLIVENEIIVERFVPEREYKKLFVALSKDWGKTMLGRSHVTYFLPDELFDTKTEIMMFPDVAMIYETHRKRIVVLKDKETIKAFAALFEMMRKVGYKINSEEEFRKYVSEH